MTDPETATGSLEAPAAAVRAALLSPTELPRWNPAFAEVTGPDLVSSARSRYRLRVRGGLAGHLEYTAVTDDQIQMRWQVPGFTEDGLWELTPHGHDTLITHRFRHHGLLAHVLSPAYRGIAEQRLARLAQHLGVTLEPGPPADP
jgi:uncharacterized protein YndB with AHSA1/START domain